MTNLLGFVIERMLSWEADVGEVCKRPFRVTSLKTLVLIPILSHYPFAAIGMDTE